MQLGVEMEFWVVDENGALCAGHDLIEHHDLAVPEFVESLVEVVTPPRGSPAGIAESLVDVLDTLLTHARETDRHLVPLGTPLTVCDSPVASDRGDLLERIYGDGLAVARNCAGTHVHFEQGNVARQLNLLTALDPALALVASSPFYEGERLANSSRAYAYRYRAGHEFGEYRDLWAYTDDPEEWERRLQWCYEDLRTMASNRGVSAEEFAAHFDPEDVVTTPVRLRRETPTVEWRSPDTTLPSHVVALLEDLAPLVARTADLPVTVGAPGVTNDEIRVPEYAELQQLSSTAIERGLDSPFVWKYLEAFDVDTTRYHPLSGQFYAGDTIAADRARRVRLEAARLLERDVDALHTALDRRAAFDSA
ncbi:glutamate-cysteine ligase family protein [Halomarina oriensis]|uniref:Glutamate--cysteine ligase n=1 Tax=Halomarina oriensis TaxID=671145 RepID=A0A6B0GE25_9EURY|nr:glutamate-cysteine ligase family protein [Halomarina oriensis]MWG33062.1 glutamate--cysteine ligase [Halomarina oriensis]